PTLFPHPPPFRSLGSPPPDRDEAPVTRGPVLVVDDVAYSYGENRGVGPTSLELERGEVVALTGPNGSGKTTLAKLAAGLLEHQRGKLGRSGRAAYLSQD